MNLSTELSFGEWLKRKRKALDLTREELAKRAGYSAATIRKIEDEERRPSEQIVERLVEIFKIPQNERETFLQFARGGSTLEQNRPLVEGGTADNPATRAAESYPFFALIGNPSHLPKSSGKSPAWPRGRRRKPKPNFAVIKKTSTAAKTA